MQTAAAYIRVSTDDQLEYSPESQMELIQKYAKEHDMILPAEYIFREAEGISGRKANKRPEFQRMIATARAKESDINVILVWKFSRFARNQEESIVYKSLLKREKGISVVSISEPISDGEFGSLIERIIEWMDGYYSVRLAGEVKRGMTKAFETGHPVSVAPIGYLMKDSKLVPDPETAPLVQMIFRDYLNGMGAKKIAMKINAMGIRTRRGNLWENRTVDYVLRNPVYIGKIRWNPDHITRRSYDDPSVKIVDGKHEPILDTKTWTAVQSKIKENRILNSKYVHHITPSLHSPLQGIVKCSNCGSTLSFTHGGFQCCAFAHGQCTESHYISLNKLETMVYYSINIDLTSGNISLIHRTHPEKEKESLAILRQQLERERQKLARVKEAYASGVDTLEEYKQNKVRINKQIAKLESQLKQSSAPIDMKAYCKDRLARLKRIQSPDVPMDEKAKLMRSFVDHIVFDRQSCSAEVFYYA
ncbi:MAG TPA: recombinase family protein [Ruminococcaceae bacterium]|jgi:DNA invertase Pin-like site-specific DNA recombinase|nr:recombinase family protein [Oscillospiraceae bacterium]HCC02300.1 recombinase family protein [Oscillospiraceae bacterium]HCM23784.1 recombinase family protein [Oscillospiraceae bacterium]